MPSFSDSVFLFILALLLFGPKKLPVLARELGKWIGEFRRASNEFKMQMEEELRQAEQADRQKQIAAMEAAAPVTPPVAEPSYPELPPAAEEAARTSTEEPVSTPEIGGESPHEPLPIATSGDLKMMPPSTGLPMARGGDPLGGLLDSIPQDGPESVTEDGQVAMAGEDSHAR